MHLPLPTFQQLLLAIVPSGGQGTARRNAWAAMSADAARARTRREAASALTVSAAAADRRAAAPG